MRIWIKTDFWLGLIVCGGGIFAYIESLKFDEWSGHYPQFLSFIHIVIGIGLIFKAIRAVADTPYSITHFFAEVKGPLLIALLLIGWSVLINVGVGYLFSSFIMMPMTLYALGYHNFKRMALGALSISLSVFILFYVIFDVPLPVNPILERFIG